MLVSPPNYSFPIAVAYSAIYYTCTEARAMETEVGGYNTGKILMKGKRRISGLDRYPLVPAVRPCLQEEIDFTYLAWNNLFINT